jgi:hypothetical protein
MGWAGQGNGCLKSQNWREMQALIRRLWSAKQSQTLSICGQFGLSRRRRLRSRVRIVGRSLVVYDCPQRGIVGRLRGVI